MARVCQITGAKVCTGNKIHRSGRAKKKGRIGRHVTETVKRRLVEEVKDIVERAKLAEKREAKEQTAAA